MYDTRKYLNTPEKYSIKWNFVKFINIANFDVEGFVVKFTVCFASQKCNLCLPRYFELHH